MMCIPHSGSLPCMAIMQRAPFSPRTPMRTGAPEVVSPVSSATPPHPSSLVVRGTYPWAGSHCHTALGTCDHER